MAVIPAWALTLSSYLAIFAAGIFCIYIWRIQHHKRIAIEAAEQRNTLSRLKHLHNNLPGIVYQAFHSPRSGMSVKYMSDRILDYGLTPEKVYESIEAIFAIMHPDDLVRMHIAISKANQYLTPFHEEIRLIHKNGTSWVEVRAILTSAENSSIIWDGMMIDITARKNAETALKESEEKLKLMAMALANSANGVMLAEANTTEQSIIYLNPAFTEITGYTAQEALGKPILFLQDDESQSALLLKHAIEKGEYRRVLTRSLRKNGMPFWSDYSLSPIRNRFGDVTHFVGVITNVTELKNVQEQLEEANRDLLKNNNALIEARKTAEKAIAIKGDFLANMSHEIRTPLYGILGTVQLLSQSPLNKDQHKWISILQQTGDSLFSIINDILDFSKLESGAYTLHETTFDPLGLLQDIVQLQKQSALHKSLNFEVISDLSEPLFVLGDQERIRQIISNFVANAIKFTEKGTISLSLEHKKAADGLNQIRFAVSDEGIGIHPAHLQRVFDKFTQEDASINRRFGGTGLGLAICKQLAELMGGKVGVQSTLGQGSTFWFEASFQEALPAIKNEKESLTVIPSHNFAGKRILLVEDNPINQTVTAAMLNAFQIDVVQAVDGHLALEAYPLHTYDLILMDLQMPGISGMETTRRIRRYETENQLSHVPIVAFSANVMGKVEEECIESGMNGYLSKPLHSNELLAVLIDYLSSDNPILIQKDKLNPQLDFPQLSQLHHLLGIEFDALCDRFISDTASRIESIKSHAREKDFLGVTAIAHSVKSAAMNMGAKQLHNHFQTLEEITLKKNADQLNNIHSLIDKTEKEFKAVIKALELYREKV